MPLTRRTAQFRALAEAIEAAWRSAGGETELVDAGLVDELLNARIAHVAAMMRISPRAALRYAPDDLPAILAEALHQHVEAVDAGDVLPLGGRRSQRNDPRS